MVSGDVLRWTWTLATGFGTLMMLVLLREVIIDNWAISQVRRPGTDVLRMIARNEVTDQWIRLAAIGTLFVAGVASLIHLTEIALWLLIASALAQIFLGTAKVLHRRKLFRQIRVRSTVAK
jgi:hypothetical protein